MNIYLYIYLQFSKWNLLNFLVQHDVTVLTIQHIVEGWDFAVVYVGTWWIGTGSWSFSDKRSCFAVTNKHGKCCFTSWYIFHISGCNADSLRTAFNCLTVCFSVPLHVKLKVGRTWGSLQPFQADQYENLLVP